MSACAHAVQVLSACCDVIVCPVCVRSHRHGARVWLTQRGGMKPSLRGGRKMGAAPRTGPCLSLSIRAALISGRWGSRGMWLKPTCALVPAAAPRTSAAALPLPLLWPPLPCVTHHLLRGAATYHTHPHAMVHGVLLSCPLTVYTPIFRGTCACRFPGWARARGTWARWDPDPGGQEPGPSLDHESGPLPGAPQAPWGDVSDLLWQLLLYGIGISTQYTIYFM